MKKYRLQSKLVFGLFLFVCRPTDLIFSSVSQRINDLDALLASVNTRPSLNESLAKRTAQLKNQHQALVDQLKNALDTTTTYKCSKMSDETDVCSNMANLVKEFNKIKSENDSVQKQLTTLKIGTTDGFAKTVNDVIQQKVDNDKALQTLNDEKKQLTDENTQMKDKNTQLTNELAVYKGQLDQVTAELDKIPLSGSSAKGLSDRVNLLTTTFQKLANGYQDLKAQLTYENEILTLEAIDYIDKIKTTITDAEEFRRCFTKSLLLFQIVAEKKGNTTDIIACFNDFGNNL